MAFWYVCALSRMRLILLVLCGVVGAAANITHSGRTEDIAGLVSLMPLLETPPFPEYTSGNSTFSGAAAVVLAHFFGSDRFRFSVGSDDLPGIRRSYRSFSEAAHESGASRIYGGIHFPSANVHGLSTGGAVGLYVAWNLLMPIER